jgi:deoxycytidine triphosphate deaminase
VILTAAQILVELKLGTIEIEPFDESRLNPNSYNLRLEPRLLQYAVPVLDCREKNPVSPTIIDPEDGFVVEPGYFFLGATIERTATDHFVPMLDGRSSLARLGLSVHQTAARGPWRSRPQCLCASTQAWRSAKYSSGGLTAQSTDSIKENTKVRQAHNPANCTRR